MSDESTTIDQTKQAERTSAKIYAFPPRGRYAVAGLAEGRQVLPIIGGAAVSIAPRNAWYHEAALEPDRKV